MERRRKLIARAVWSLVFAAFVAHADQFNDLYYVDPGGVPDLSEEGKQNDGGSGGSGGAEDNSSGTSDEGSNNPSQSSGGSGSGSGVGTGSNMGDGEFSGENGTQEEGTTPTEEQVLEILGQDGAITGGLGGVAGGVFGGGGGGSGSIVVNGSRVRTSLRKDPDIDEVLRYWKIGKGKNRPFGKTIKDRLTPGEYYALVAATLAADDEQFVEARFTARDFEVTYRSRGALFAFIPFSFPVRVFVSPYGKEGDRATVKFPWYHWFVREYFTRAELALEIDTALQDVIAKAEEGEDIHAELFEAVTRMLQQKVRTITDSILLR